MPLSTSLYAGALILAFLQYSLTISRHLALHCVPVRRFMRVSQVTWPSSPGDVRHIARSSSFSSLSDHSESLAASLGAMSLYHFSRHCVKVRVPMRSDMAVQSILSRWRWLDALSSTVVLLGSRVLPWRARLSFTSCSSLVFSSSDQRPFLRFSPSLISRHLFATAFSLRSSCAPITTQLGRPDDFSTNLRSLSSSSFVHLPL
mmetsp:Transcript_9334/g.38259  ORF Transcript_9334/g.38259 Transcript_9334/m.38259 type:complete len:203 (-) Transcript_9334:649-1257(-)